MSDRATAQRNRTSAALEQSRQAWPAAPRAEPAAADRPIGPADSPAPPLDLGATLDPDLRDHLAAGRLDLATAAALQTLRHVEALAQRATSP